MGGLRGPSLGIRRLGPLAGLVEPSSSRACFNHRCKKSKDLDVITTSLRTCNASYARPFYQRTDGRICGGIAAGWGSFQSSTFLQEPVVGGVSGSSRERRLPVGTTGVVGLRLARNGDEKRT